jgi:hypothetical protein
MKYMTFCEGINGDGARKSNKLLNMFVDLIYKKRNLESSGTAVLYMG